MAKVKLCSHTLQGVFLVSKGKISLIRKPLMIFETHKSKLVFILQRFKFRYLRLNIQVGPGFYFNRERAPSLKYKWQRCEAYVHLYLEYMAVEPLARTSKPLPPTQSGTLVLDPKKTSKELWKAAKRLETIKNMFRSAVVRWRIGVVARTRRWRWECRSTLAGRPTVVKSWMVSWRIVWSSFIFELIFVAHPREEKEE